MRPRFTTSSSACSMRPRLSMTMSSGLIRFVLSAWRNSATVLPENSGVERDVRFFAAPFFADDDRFFAAVVLRADELFFDELFLAALFFAPPFFAELFFAPLFFSAMCCSFPGVAGDYSMSKVATTTAWSERRTR